MEYNLKVSMKKDNPWFYEVKKYCEVVAKSVY